LGPKLPLSCFSVRGRLKKDDRERKNRMLEAKKKGEVEQRDDIANVCGAMGESPWGEEDIMEVLN